MFSTRCRKRGVVKVRRDLRRHARAGRGDEHHRLQRDDERVREGHCVERALELFDAMPGEGTTGPPSRTTWRWARACAGGLGSAPWQLFDEMEEVGLERDHVDA